MLRSGAASGALAFLLAAVLQHAGEGEEGEVFGEPGESAGVSVQHARRGDGDRIPLEDDLVVERLLRRLAATSGVQVLSLQLLLGAVCAAIALAMLLVGSFPPAVLLRLPPSLLPNRKPCKL